MIRLFQAGGISVGRAGALVLLALMADAPGMASGPVFVTAQTQARIGNGVKSSCFLFRRVAIPVSDNARELRCKHSFARALV